MTDATPETAQEGAPQAVLELSPQEMRDIGMIILDKVGRIHLASQMMSAEIDIEGSKHKVTLPAADFVQVCPPQHRGSLVALAAMPKDSDEWRAIEGHTRERIDRQLEQGGISVATQE